MVRSSKLHEFLYIVSVLLSVAPTAARIFIPDATVCFNLAIINYTVKGNPAPRVTWSQLFGERAFAVNRSSIESDGITSTVMSTLEIRTEQNDSRRQSLTCVEAENGAISITSTKMCFMINAKCKNSVVKELRISFDS